MTAQSMKVIKTMKAMKTAGKKGMKVMKTVQSMKVTGMKIMKTAQSMNEVKVMKTAQSMKVMKAMKTAGKNSKNPAKNAMEAMKTANTKNKKATETAAKKLPQTKRYKKVWSCEHMGLLYQWKLGHIVNKGGFVTEFWDGKLRGDINKM
jgi:hypothetical protein